MRSCYTIDVRAGNMLRYLISDVIYMPVKIQKLPLEIVKEKFGEEPPVKSDIKIKAYLNSKGYKSLSKLIEAK